MIKNMKIGKRLMSCFILVAIVASISGVLSIFITNGLHKKFDTTLEDYGFVQGDVGRAMLALAENTRVIRDLITLTDEEDLANAKQKLENNKALYNQYADIVRESISNEEARQIANDISTKRAAFEAKRDEVLALGESTDASSDSRALQMAIDELDPLYDDLYDAWMNFLDVKEQKGREHSQQMQRETNIVTVITIVLIIASLIIAFLFGVLISRQVADPIGKCVDRLTKLAQGDLKTPVPQSDSTDETGVLMTELGITVKAINAMIGDLTHMLGEMARGNFAVKSNAEDAYVGEFGQLIESIKELSQDMNTTLSQINQSSDQVASGADQVSSGAQALSQGATEQASSVEELAATINEISNQINITAQNAETAKEENVKVDEMIQVCGNQMQSLVGAINLINEKSNEISKIIKAIEDIAFQTNILALNAAVEAARAGAAGKGFAVVAGEVRDLAEKSAEAAKSTTVLIGETVSAVASGTKLSEETAQSLLKVVENAKSVLSAVTNISQATGEQAQSISQVTMGIDQISSVVQTNSATAQQSAAASEELSAQAQMLKNLIGKFKLDGDTDVSAAMVSYNKPASTPSYEYHADTSSYGGSKY